MNLFRFIFTQTLHLENLSFSCLTDQLNILKISEFHYIENVIFQFNFTFILQTKISIDLTEEKEIYQISNIKSY